MIITLIVSALIIGAMWNKIMNFFMTTLLPWLKNHISADIYDLFSSIVSWVDDKVVLARHAIQNGYKWIKESLMGCTTQFSLNGNYDIVEKQKTIIDNLNGTVTVYETERQIDSLDITAETLKALQENAKNIVVRDNKEALEAKYEARAEREQLSLAQ